MGWRDGGRGRRRRKERMKKTGYGEEKEKSVQGVRGEKRRMKGRNKTNTLNKVGGVRAKA